MTKRGDIVADVIATVGVNYSSCQCLSRRAQPAAAPSGRRGSGVFEEGRHGQAGHRRSNRETKTPRKAELGGRALAGTLTGAVDGGDTPEAPQAPGAPSDR